MTKNEFKAAIACADNLIQDANAILENILNTTQLSFTDHDELLGALLSLYPDETGESALVDDVYETCSKFFTDSDNDIIAEPDLWTQYIAYLHEWANDHKDAAFCGCTPACFEEWYDNEHAEEDD